MYLILFIAMTYLSEFIIYQKWYFNVVLNSVQSNAIINTDKMD